MIGPLRGAGFGPRPGLAAAGGMLAMEADRREQIGHVVVVEAVADMPAIPLAEDEAEESEHAQLLGDDGGAQAAGQGQVLDCSLDAEQGIEDPEPAGGGEGGHGAG